MIRERIWDKLRDLTPPGMRRWIKSRSWFTPVAKVMFGNEVYSDGYYRDVERIESESVRHMADWIKATLAPARVVDIGCGPGHLLRALHERGIRGLGVDVSSAALARARKDGVAVEWLDLTVPGVAISGCPFDLAISCEVAEHLDARYARAFVERLTASAPVVYLTAAEPDANVGVGLYHVNEQPNDYWVALMRERGYIVDQGRTDDARRYLGSRDVVSYLKRPLLFRRSP